METEAIAKVSDIETETRECYQCNEPIAATATEREWNDELYHDECLLDITSQCQRCMERVSDDDTREVSGETWCEDCTDAHAYKCDDCGEYMTQRDVYEYNNTYYCEYHHDQARGRDDETDEDEDDSPYREYSSKDLPDFQSNDFGKIIKSTRVFSAEIEGYYPNSQNLRDISETANPAIGISTDGSLNSRGVEFQTPKLKGMNGEKAMENLCKVLNDGGLTVDRSTGLHIHLDGTDLIPKKRTKGGVHALRTMFAFYLTYEDVLLSFLPPSRRGNRYCDNLGKSYHIREVLALESLEGLEKLWYRVKLRRALKRNKDEHYHESRYNGVNMHSLIADGHLEIRYHSGTTNPRKILEWANLHARIMDMSVPVEKEDRGWTTTMKYLVPGISKDILLRAMNTRNLKEKTESMFELLKLTASSRDYFRARQAAFSSDKNDRDESDSENVNETLPCAA